VRDPDASVRPRMRPEQTMGVARRLVTSSSIEASARSAAYHSALYRVGLFARDDTAPILLQGESGTGKTQIARRIHGMSPRASGPFQHIVLSTLDDGLASSELFGHVAG